MPAAPSNESALIPAIPSDGGRIGLYWALSSLSRFSFDISYDGVFRLCSALWHPECTYDLVKGNLGDAWRNFVPRVRDMRSTNRRFLETCQSCRIANLCYSCPAHNYLEHGDMDVPVDYFCRAAHARAEALGYNPHQTTAPSHSPVPACEST